MITSRMPLIFLAMISHTRCAAEDFLTLVACNDTEIATIVVIDDKSILYLASNSKTTEKGVSPDEKATILKEGAIDHVYVVLGNYDGHVVLRYMKTELGQAFAVTGNGLPTPFSQVPFGIVSEDDPRIDGYFAKVKISRKALQALPNSKEELLTFTLDKLKLLQVP